MELIAALLHGPRVLFLDEPTIGLDVVSQKNIRDFLRNYNRREGATIILTSHYPSDIEDLCQRVILIHQGQVRYDGELANISGLVAADRVLRVTLGAPPDAAARQILHRIAIQEGTGNERGAAPGVGVEAGQTLLLRVRRERTASVASAVLANLAVTDLTIEDVPLEETLRAIYGEAMGQ